MDLTVVTEDHETICWGCGLRLLLSSYTPVYKCGWCGAITSPNMHKHESKCVRWRHLRDRCFVCILIIFMLFVICGGLLAVYPVVFSISYFYGVFHSTITLILSVSTLSTFSLAAFCCAGTPPNMTWGSYPVVGKGSLENYTFCHYCSKPKSPRTHHCRSCGMCILDMDHHCPFALLGHCCMHHLYFGPLPFFGVFQYYLLFGAVILNHVSAEIGNCVGAANHRYFIAFLISAVISTTYVAIMSLYAGFHIWPPLTYRPLGRLNGSGADSGIIAIKEIIIAFMSSAVHLSLRGIVLVYLFVSSVSVEIGLSVLLWQQLCFIYEGKTYLTHLSSHGDDAAGDRDCRNLLRFFGCPYSASKYFTSFSTSMKRHKK